MKNHTHNAAMGATAGCTLRLLEEYMLGDPLERHGIKGDAWFGTVSTAMEIGECGEQAVLQVKVNKGLYPKDLIDNALKDVLVDCRLCCQE